MGVGRITQGMISQRTLTNIRDQLLRLSTLQNQLGTGLRVNRPSDDPIDARRGVNLRTLIGENEQFLSNIQDARPMLTEGADVLHRVVNVIHRVRELTLQGANETNSQQQLDLIALEIDQLLEETVAAANHQTNGRYIFAGTRTLTPAYTETRVSSPRALFVASPRASADRPHARPFNVPVTGSYIHLLPCLQSPT